MSSFAATRRAKIFRPVALSFSPRAGLRLTSPPRGARPASAAARLQSRVLFWENFRHKRCMAKAKVTFKIVRLAEDDWNIQADYPGLEPRQITGLKSKADADEWINGDRRIAWL